jgi:soluble lytic murein transglycosylase
MANALWRLKFILVAIGPLVAGGAPATAASPNGMAAVKMKLPVEPSATAPAAVQASPPVAAPAPIPRPLPRDVQHAERYDAAIALVRDHALQVEDATRIRDAFKAISSGNLAHGKTLRDQISDPIGRKLIDWYLYRSGKGTAREIRTFLDTNPAWPEPSHLNQRAEEALFSGNSARETKSYFASRDPQTGAGLAALASASLADGDVERAKALASKAWRLFDMTAHLETHFLEQFKNLLTNADHKARLDRLLLEDSRWQKDRNDRAQIVRRVLPLLSEPERKQAEARLAIYLRSPQSEQQLAALPSGADAQADKDWGLAFQRIQLLRRSGKFEQAWQILLAAPKNPSAITSPDAWWEERRLGAYAALKAGKPRIAYDLVRDPGPLTVNPAKDAAFLAGWIALRYLNDPKTAVTHFRALEKAADGPLSNAKAAYWLGRTSEALGQANEAQKRYRTAANYYDTFHGQLARLKLDVKAQALPMGLPAAPSSEESSRFNGLDAVKAVVVARRSGLDISITRAFFAHLRSHLQTEAEMAMLAHLAEALGDTQSALRIGKAGIARGFNLAYYAYPVTSMPQYSPLRPPPEPAFLLAIARQESEFDPTTFSGAGARGILQVMPVTARHVCHDYRLKCQIDRLMTDQGYNAMMASAYIADRMDEFAGSYVLTLAGYNAGPGRARQWMHEFGDPREAKVDAIDWIHRIPIEETREYVQKVLANIQVYRARLGEDATALRLNADLKRVAAGAHGRPRANN